jgi:hypothetical protein
MSPETTVETADTAAPVETPPARKTDAEIAAVMYPSTNTDALVSSYGPVLRPSAEELANRTGMSRAQVDEHVKNTAVLFYEAGVHNESFAAKLHGQVVKYGTEPADDETVSKWEQESNRKLRETYSDSDRSRREARVKEFLSKRPEFAKTLADSGLGSHPDFVLTLFENADRLQIVPSTQRKA